MKMDALLPLLCTKFSLFNGEGFKELETLSIWQVQSVRARWRFGLPSIVMIPTSLKSIDANDKVILARFFVENAYLICGLDSVSFAIITGFNVLRSSFLNWKLFFSSIDSDTRYFNGPSAAPPSIMRMLLLSDLFWMEYCNVLQGELSTPQLDASLPWVSEM